MILQVMREANTLLRKLAQLPNPIFLHGNIEMWNVLVDESGGLRLLDFEDVMLGHPIQDVAITFFYGAERQDYTQLIGAYKEVSSLIKSYPPGFLKVSQSHTPSSFWLTNYELLIDG